MIVFTIIAGWLVTSAVLAPIMGAVIGFGMRG